MLSHALAGILQQKLEDAIHQQNVPGAVAAVALQRDGEVLLAAGFEDLDRSTPMRAHRRFPIWSISKTFIAVVVLRLVQRKVLALDDQVEKWLPQIASARVVTVRQMLNHTSGLPDYGKLESYEKAVREEKIPWTDSQFVEQTCGNGLAFEPGQGWGYSNIGYLFIRKIIEVATGRSWAEVVRSEVIAPLHLMRTAVVQSPEDFTMLAPGHSRFLDPSGGWTDVRQWYHPGWVAHGFLASTAEDVNRFFQGLFAGELLDAHHLTSMLQLVPVPGHPSTADAGYGLGIAGETDQTFGHYFGHEGSGPGYRVIASHVPAFLDRGATITVCSNTDSCSPRKISDALLQGLFRYLKQRQDIPISQPGGSPLTGGSPLN